MILTLNAMSIGATLVKAVVDRRIIRQPLSLDTAFSFLTRQPDKEVIMHHITTCFSTILDLFETKFVGSGHPHASQIIDCCIALRQKCEEDAPEDEIAHLFYTIERLCEVDR
ncbi:MAG: hypothetical protein KJO32_13735 [Deltaproteobacteria bacterium]|nr:hypothetical protein [Deltaproteobacteria bacterium]